MGTASVLEGFDRDDEEHAAAIPTAHPTNAPAVDAVTERVLIVYATVIVLEDGLVHFYDDIYKYDTALEKVLAKGYQYPW